MPRHTINLRAHLRRISNDPYYDDVNDGPDIEPEPEEREEPEDDPTMWGSEVTP